jgi:hypothetical protein
MIDPTDFNFDTLDIPKIVPPLPQSPSPNTKKSFIVPVVLILFGIGAIAVAMNLYNEIQNEKKS